MRRAQPACDRPSRPLWDPRYMPPPHRDQSGQQQGRACPAQQPQAPAAIQGLLQATGFGSLHSKEWQLSRPCDRAPAVPQGRLDAPLYCSTHGRQGAIIAEHDSRHCYLSRQQQQGSNISLGGSTECLHALMQKLLACTHTGSTHAHCVRQHPEKHHCMRQLHMQ